MNLEKKRPLFFQVGFVVALSVSLLAFEWQSITSIQKEIAEDGLSAEIVEAPPVVILEQPKPKPKTQPVKTFVVKEDDEVPDDDPLDDMNWDEDFDPELPDDLDLGDGDDKIEETDFVIVEVMPTYRGGEAERIKYLNKNVKYPKIAKENGIQGPVYVEFVLDKEGFIRDAVVKRGIGGGCDEEALRVVKAMPGWIPGEQRGRKVSVKMVMTINFKLRS